MARVAYPMHLFKTLTTLAAVSAATVSASFAAPTIASAALAPAVRAPVPATIVRPVSLPRQYENSVVRVAMLVDSAGVPHNVAVVGRVPYDLSFRVVPAVAQWRFTPASQDGHPIAMRVILPIRLVADESSG